MIRQIIFLEGGVGLHNCEQYLRVKEFRKMFLKFKKLRRNQNRELRQIADRNIYLVLMAHYVKLVNK